jgi:tRNA threonylcarbamoyladenosine biosynthesis protein TsaE
MRSQEFLIESEEELSRLATSLIDFAGDRKVWIFKGEMGAGKTTFIRQICSALKVEQNVSSPTFSLVNEYSRENGQKVFHFDFYRINSPKEAVDIGCEEYFYGSDICLIEWPEKILNLLPEHLVVVTILDLDGKRKITFSHD